MTPVSDKSVVVVEDVVGEAIAAAAAAAAADGNDEVNARLELEMAAVDCCNACLRFRPCCDRDMDNDSAF